MIDDSWSALWRRPQYRGFTLTVGALRVVGLMFMTVSVLLVLDRTGSAALAGAVAGASSIAVAASGPVLGAWLDVARSRRRLIVIDQLVTVAGLVALVLMAGHAPDWTLPVLGVGLGITSPLSSGSYVSALSEIAGADLLDRASAVEATSLNLALVLGPAIGAVLAGALGPARVVQGEAAVTLLLAAAIAVNPVFEIRGAERPRTFARALKEGTLALVRIAPLRDLMISGWFSNLGYGTLLVTFPLFAAGALGGNRNDGGYLWAALAAGSILGTFLIPGKPSWRRLAWSYLPLGLSGLLWNVAGSVPLGVALVLLTGVLDGPMYVAQMALRQRLAPDLGRAQVFTTISSLMQVSSSVGSLIGGLAGHPATAFAVFAGTQLLAGAIAGRRARLERAAPDPAEAG